MSLLLLFRNQSILLSRSASESITTTDAASSPANKPQFVFETLTISDAASSPANKPQFVFETLTISDVNAPIISQVGVT